MDRLLRLILVRHGETTGQSSIRYYGETDVPLSSHGREQIEAMRRKIELDTVEMVWASPLARAWQAARIIAPGRSIQLEAAFREIDFGRWEGLTREEIQAADPLLFDEWQSGAANFDFPEGEPRSVFRARVSQGLERVRASGAESALVVAHKGVVRTLVELVSGQTLPPRMPDLGGIVYLHREDRVAGRAGPAQGAEEVWAMGRPGSDSSCSVPPLSGLIPFPPTKDTA